MSSFDNVETEIDGHKVKTTLFGASKAFKVHYKFLGKIGRSLGSVLGGVTGILVDAAKSANSGGKFDTAEFLGVMADSDLNLSFFGDAVAALYDSMDEDEALKYFKYILETTTVEGIVVNDSTFEKTFGSGRTIFLYKVLKFVLEANYMDFFAVFRNFKKEVPKSPSIPEATAAT